MKSISNYLFILISLLLLPGCNKENDQISEEDISEISVSEFMPMKVGNFWVYRLSVISDGEIIPQSHFDSISVTSDTTIDGHEFYVLEGSRFGLKYKSLLRDSADCIINERGRVRFKANPDDRVWNTYVQLNDQLLSDTLFTIEYSTLKENKIVKTPAGSFDSRVTMGIVNLKDKAEPESKKVRAYYVRNMGIVREETFLLSDEIGLVRELVNYRIQP